MLLRGKTRIFSRYQKYLYDYECEKEGLSKPEDLQAAIEGNRREGRRSNANYSPYSLAPSLVAQKHHHHHLNGSSFRGIPPHPHIPKELRWLSASDDDPAVVPGIVTPTSLAGQQAALAAYREQFVVLEAQRQLEQARK